MTKRLRLGIVLTLTAAVVGVATALAMDNLALNQAVETSAPHRLTPADTQKALQQLERRLQVYDKDYEASLLKGLILFKSGQVDAALSELDRLTTVAPTFHLAHLVKADILQSRLNVVTDLGATPLLQGETKAQREQINRLRDEAHARLRAYLESVDDHRIPAQLLQLGSSVKTAILVDKTNHRLYVYENPGRGEPPRLLRDFYVSTGKLIGNKQSSGDLKTPEGVYFVVSHMDDANLPDKYGIGAFPLNYPNELDGFLGKTGHGIWLHGTDKGYYSRPPLDSEGCVVLTNFDLDAVSPYITPGITPVVITQEVEWLEQAAWQLRRDELLASIDAWRSDWESLDVERYLGHYADDFWSSKYDKRSWSEYKRSVFSGKSYQKVGLNDISLFTYPSASLQGRRMVVVNLLQQYESNNFTSSARKRLYLSKVGADWKVVYEGGQ